MELLRARYPSPFCLSGRHRFTELDVNIVIQIVEILETGITVALSAELPQELIGQRRRILHGDAQVRLLRTQMGDGVQSVGIHGCDVGCVGPQQCNAL